MKMKKYLILAIAAVSLLACGEETALNPRQAADGVVFNLDARHPGTATKAVKTGWETGDVIFVFFTGAASPAYLEMKWDGGKWNNTSKNGLSLPEDASGKMRAVYLPFGNGATVANVDGAFSFSETYYAYYLTAELPYTVTDNTVSGSFQMRIPEGFVQFFVDDADATDGKRIELREPKMTPVGIASVSADGQVVTSALAHGAPMPGYLYDKEEKSAGEAKGWLFSGILAEDSRGVAEDYYFTLVKNGYNGPYYYKETPGRAFYRGESDGRAVKLPALDKWEDVSDTTRPIDLGVDVDGRRVYWSWRNLGAAVEVELGDYFAYGETEPYYVSLNPQTWKDGKSNGYSWSSYKFATAGTGSSVTKYNGQDYKALLPEDDAAHTALGGIWRIPTQEEWNALVSSCTIKWIYYHYETPEYGVKYEYGIWVEPKVTGSQQVRVFFPATGIFVGTQLDLDKSYPQNMLFGHYWSSSSSYNVQYAYKFYFKKGNSGDTAVTGVYNNDERFYGCSIRPVTY